MAQVAYELERFAQNSRPAAPRLRVAQKRQHSEAKAQTLRMLRTLALIVTVLLLVCSVLYTQAKLAELQSRISSTQKQLLQEQADYTYLTYELESKTNIRNIEERAQQLGLQKIDAGQFVYVRMEDSESVIIKKDPLSGLFSSVRNGFLNIAQSFTS